MNGGMRAPHDVDELSEPQEMYTPRHNGQHQGHLDNGNMASTSGALPKLHYYAYQGDLEGVLACITSGHNVHEAVTMRSQRNKLVGGITPLFLAAQRGHGKVVKVLVQNGANPAQPSWIHSSSDLCTPAQVARLNLHFLVAHYLKKQEAARRAEDAVLREEENTVNNRVNSMAVGPAPAPGPAVSTAAIAMTNLGDLSGWDPASGDPPPQLAPKEVKKLMKRNKIDLDKFQPDWANEKTMAPSSSRAVDPYEAAELDTTDHGQMLSSFLKDADLVTWNPEQGSLRERQAAEAAAAGGQPVSRSVRPNGYNVRSGPPAAGAAPAAGLTPAAARDPSPARPVVPMHLPPTPDTAAPRQVSIKGRRSQDSTASSTRAAARAAAAASMSRPRMPTAAARNARWYAHGESDDEDDHDENVTVSASEPVNPMSGRVLA